MSTSSGNSHDNMELQQPVCMPDENSGLFRVLNNVPLASNNETTKEQQIVYYTVPANIQPINSNQPYVCLQQLPNSQMANQYPPTSLFVHHQPQQQQQLSLNNNVAHGGAQQPMLHSNMFQQQAFLSTCQPAFNIMEMPSSSMSNPTVSSTPISASAKRGRNDTSGISESNIQVRPQYPQITRVLNTNNTSIKRHRVLGEVGHVDLSLVGAALSNYDVFYQAGENAHGGVLVLIRKDIHVTRVSCSLPNICVIDIFLSEIIRLIAIYAPASKTWNWTDLTTVITNRCMIMGDFNIDIERDGDKADRLLEWLDSCSLRPVVPDSYTSLRSDRTIDYAVTNGVDLTMQTYEGDISSDHKPLLGVFTDDGAPKTVGSRTIWPVFSLVLSYTYEYWEKKEWNTQLSETTYEHFILFLTSLSYRCQQYFAIKRARPSVPQELLKLLTQSRSLSFKAKRKGDIQLRNEAHRLRNLARFELKRFQQEQLAKQLKERYVQGEGSTLFWNKTKRHFRHVSSSLRGFATLNGEIIKDPQVMANTAAEYYEKLFQAPIRSSVERQRYTTR
ncbi:unnamed protein product [Rotaria sp. Silwood2]|nr:unnamed protein product [Rotaria sp. Silwood2]